MAFGIGRSRPILPRRPRGPPGSVAPRSIDCLVGLAGCAHKRTRNVGGVKRTSPSLRSPGPLDLSSRPDRKAGYSAQLYAIHILSIALGIYGARRPVLALANAGRFYATWISAASFWHNRAKDARAPGVGVGGNSRFPVDQLGQLAEVKRFVQPSHAGRQFGPDRGIPGDHHPAHPRQSKPPLFHPR